MRVVAGDAHVQRGGEVVADRLEEMRHHFGRQFADAIARKFGFEDEPGAAAEVEGDLGLRFVHGHDETVAADAAFVAERLLRSAVPSARPMSSIV